MNTKQILKKRRFLEVLLKDKHFLPGIRRIIWMWLLMLTGAFPFGLIITLVRGYRPGLDATIVGIMLGVLWILYWKVIRRILPK